MSLPSTFTFKKCYISPDHTQSEYCRNDLDVLLSEIFL